MLKVHIITHNDMDGFLWGVLEGWLLSGRIPNDLEVRVSGTLKLLPQSPDFWETLPSTNAVLFCCTSGDRSNMVRGNQTLDELGLWDHTVHSDYVHNDALLYPGVAKKCRWCFVGKRYKWLRVKEQLPRSEWLPRTGIQQRMLRYSPALPWGLWKDLPMVGVYGLQHRGQHHRKPWVKAMKDLIPGAVLGGVREEDRGVVVPPIYREVYRGKHNPKYLEFASRARVGLYLMGGLALGHQFWEFAALRCALLAMHPSLHPTPEEDTQEWEHFPDPLLEDRDFFYFRNQQEMLDKARLLLADPELAECMADSVFEKTKFAHSIPRSEYVLAKLREVARP